MKESNKKNRLLPVTMLLVAVVSGLALYGFDWREHAEKRNLKTETSRLPVATEKDEWDKIQGSIGYRYLEEFRNSNFRDDKKLALVKDQLENIYPILKHQVTIPEERGYAGPKLLIEKQSDRYYWISNNSQPLDKHEHTFSLAFPKGTIPDDLNETVTVTVFEPLNGKGLIYIVHYPPKRVGLGCAFHNMAPCEIWGCFRGGVNIVQLQFTKDGALQSFIGRTEPFPYPVRDVCDSTLPMMSEAEIRDE